MKTKFGRLERVDLRDHWKGEAAHFTPWLAQEENIALLSEEIGIDLEVQSHEERVGLFRADILCKDTITDKFVLIENQLERTDHEHLGQLITYAAGLDAVTIIWIARNFTEEHRAALDWLNRITDEEINFFGIEIELYKIGDSPPAPKFNVVSKPNDWSKRVKHSADTSKITPVKALQQEYWQALKDRIENSSSKLRPQKPLPQHWYNFAIGRSHFQVVAFANTREGRIAIKLLISGPECKKHFHLLKQMCEAEVTKVFPNEVIEWRELPEKIESHVHLQLAADPSDRSQWPSQHKWLQERIEKFTEYFGPRVKAL